MPLSRRFVATVLSASALALLAGCSADKDAAPAPSGSASPSSSASAASPTASAAPAKLRAVLVSSITEGACATPSATQITLGTQCYVLGDGIDLTSVAKVDKKQQDKLQIVTAYLGGESAKQYTDFMTAHKDQDVAVQINDRLATNFKAPASLSSTSPQVPLGPLSEEEQDSLQALVD